MLIRSGNAELASNLKTMKTYLIVILALFVSERAAAQCTPNKRAKEMERNIQSHGPRGWETFATKVVSIDNNDPTQIDFEAEPGYYYEAFVSVGYYCHGIIMALDGSNNSLGKGEELTTLGPSVPFQTSSSGIHHIAFNVISDKYSSHCVIVSVNRKKIN